MTDLKREYCAVDEKTGYQSLKDLRISRVRHTHKSRTDGTPTG